MSHLLSASRARGGTTSVELPRLPANKRSDEISEQGGDASIALTPRDTLLGAQFKEDLENLNAMKRPSPDASRAQQGAGAFFGGSAQWLSSFGAATLVVKLMQATGYGAIAQAVYPLIAGISQGLVSDQFRKAAGDNYGLHPGVDLTAYNNWVIAKANQIGVGLTGNEAQRKKAMAKLDKAFNDLVLSHHPEIVQERNKLQQKLKEILLTAPADQVEAALKAVKEPEDARLKHILDEQGGKAAEYVASTTVRKFLREDLPLVCWVGTLGLAGIASPSILAATGGMGALFVASDLLCTLLMGALAGGAGATMNNWLRSGEGSVAKAGNHDLQIRTWAKSDSTETSAEQVIAEAPAILARLDQRIKELEAAGPQGAQPFTLAEIRNVRANANSIYEAALSSKKFYASSGGFHGRNIYATVKAIPVSLNTGEKRWAAFHKVVGNVGALYLYSYVTINNMSEKMHAVALDLATGNFSFASQSYLEAVKSGASLGLSFATNYLLRSVITPASYMVVGVPWAAVRTLAARCCCNPEDEADEPEYHEAIANTDPAVSGEDARGSRYVPPLTAVTVQGGGKQLTVGDYKLAANAWQNCAEDVSDKIRSKGHIAVAIKNLARGELLFDAVMGKVFEAAALDDLATYRNEIADLKNTALASQDDFADLHPVLEQMSRWLDIEIAKAPDAS